MTLIINGKTYEAGELIAYVENLEKENIELKDYNKKLLQGDIDKQNKIVLLSQKVNELQKENAELKEKLKPENRLKLLVKKGYIKFTSDQLTKATEIIKKLYAVYYDPCVTESDLKYRDDLFAEVKQFISDIKEG